MPLNVQFISSTPTPGSNNTPPPPNPASVTYPAYSTYLTVPIDIAKSASFATAAVLKIGGGALAGIGNAFSSAGEWLKSTGNPVLNWIGNGLQWLGNQISGFGSALIGAGNNLSNYGQALGTSGNWQSTQLQPGGENYNIGPTYSVALGSRPSP